MFTVLGGLLAIPFIFSGLLHLLSLMIDPQPNEDALIIGLVLMIMGLFASSMPIYFVFRIYFFQHPILSIYQEGIEIRSTGFPSKTRPSVGYFDRLWQSIVFRIFPLRKDRLQWKYMSHFFPANRGFMIVGWFDCPEKINLGFGSPFAQAAYSFGADYFSVPIKKVIESILYFMNDPEAREELPSWRDNETLYRSTSAQDKSLIM